MTAQFKVGDEVSHEKFGRGNVIAIDGQRLEVDFHDYGSKRLLGSFVALADNDNVAGTDPVDLWKRRSHPPLPYGIIPEVLEEFARTQSELMGVDAGGMAASALAVCAAAIPDYIQLQVKRHDESWKESARIWVALIGSPSTKKSPVIARATAPIKAIDGRMFKEYTRLKQQYDALSADDRKATTPPKFERIRIEDISMESAQEVCKDSPNGVLALQDELSGWFGAMEKYSGGKGAAKDRSFWLQAFNGGEHAVNRIQRGASLIDNLSVSMLGGVQPEPIRKIAGDAADDGLLQRFFPIVLGEGVVGKDEPTPSIISIYKALIERLHTMQKPIRGGAFECVLRFDDDAQEIRNNLEVYHNDLQRSWGVINGKISAHVGKYDGLFARLCIIWHCVEAGGERPDPVISADTANRVATFLHDFLFPHALTFYTDILGLSSGHDHVLATAGYILSRELKDITVRDVRRGDSTMRELSNFEAEAVLEKLDAFGWLEPVPQIIRKDSKKWTVRPAVHRLFAARAKEEATRRRSVRELISDTRGH